MKTIRFISIIAVALTVSLSYVSCDKDEPLEPQQRQQQQQPQNNGIDSTRIDSTHIDSTRIDSTHIDSTHIEGAFLPDSCAGKTVAAWYAVYSEADYKKKVEAIFLFTDSTLVVTKSKVYTEEDGRDPSRVTMYEGKYEVIQGDFDKGVIVFSFTPGSSFDVEITDGKLSLMGQTYTKQDNANVPDAARSTENEFIGTVQPYMPVLNIDIDFAAWYTCTTQQDYRIKIDAIYFNTDSLMLYTRSKFYTQKDGRKPSYEIVDIGKYKFTEGDYTTGKATLTLSTGVVYDAVITDGQMSAMDLVFSKQANDTIPKPMKL